MKVVSEEGEGGGGRGGEEGRRGGGEEGEEGRRGRRGRRGGGGGGEEDGEEEEEEEKVMWARYNTSHQTDSCVLKGTCDMQHSLLQWPSEPYQLHSIYQSGWGHPTSAIKEIWDMT